MPESHSALERLHVALVSTRNPLNIGAAARAMSNFGFTRLRLVKPYEPAWREARSAVGAAQVLAEAEEFASVADAVADCTLVIGTTAARDRALHHELVRLEQAAPRVRAAMAGGRVALLFGSEKRGLSKEDLSHCQWLLRIPTREEHGAMNLGQAVALCLYELVRADTAVRRQAPARATAKQLERLTAALVDVLERSGYMPGSSEEKVRRMVRRLQLSGEDADLLLGMVRQVGWKIGK